MRWTVVRGSPCFVNDFANAQLPARTREAIENSHHFCKQLCARFISASIIIFLVHCLIQVFSRSTGLRAELPPARHHTACKLFYGLLLKGKRSSSFLNI